MEIKIEEIKLPKNVEFIPLKSAYVFKKKLRKAILKGSSLEITHPVKHLGIRLRTYSEQTRLKSHLGVVKGIVSNIDDTKDLQNILNKYFYVKTNKEEN